MQRFLVVLALALEACTNPDDILTVNGAVLSDDPVAGQVVHLRRGLNVQGLLHPGSACDFAAPHKQQVVDDERNYGFDVFRVETRRAACFRVDTSFSSGSVAWVDFGFYGPTSQLPPLRDWRSRVTLDGGVLQFEPPVPWPSDAPPVLVGSTVKFGVQLTHRAQLLLSDGGIGWQAEDRVQAIDSGSVDPNVFVYAREVLVLDAVRLEDFKGTLRLSASLHDPDEETPLLSLGPLPSRMTAAERLDVSGTRIPLSRGLPCPQLASPCPLTDGDLAEVDAGLADEVTLSLAVPAVVSAVVLRDAWVAGNHVRLKLFSEDGGLEGELERRVPVTVLGAFGSDPLGSIQTRDGGYAQLRRAWMVMSPDAGTPVSRVTVQFEGGLARIRELSLFGP